jgi:hypothetical protein
VFEDLQKGKFRHSVQLLLDMTNSRDEPILLRIEFVVTWIRTRFPTTGL